MEVPSLGSASHAAIEGLKRAQEKTQVAAQNIAEGSLNPEDVVSLSLAAADFKANVAVLKSEDEMTKSLLDIVA
jgi:flagellar basal body rod protein FlgC